MTDLLIAILLAACVVYCVARMLLKSTTDDGPFGAFIRWRAWLVTTPGWLQQIVACPICSGFWLSWLAALPVCVFLANGWIFPGVWFAISGIQAFAWDLVTE